MYENEWMKNFYTISSYISVSISTEVRSIKVFSPLHKIWREILQNKIEMKLVLLFSFSCIALESCTHDFFYFLFGSWRFVADTEACMKSSTQSSHSSILTTLITAREQSQSTITFLCAWLPAVATITTTAWYAYQHTYLYALLHHSHMTFGIK